MPSFRNYLTLPIVLLLLSIATTLPAPGASPADAIPGTDAAALRQNTPSTPAPPPKQPTLSTNAIVAWVTGAMLTTCVVFGAGVGYVMLRGRRDNKPVN